jgi:prepilin-type N-terminal cleavage/methylation domain-containing protein
MPSMESANGCNRQRDRQRGFSLIEILIAMTVTLIGLAGLLSLHFTTVQGNARATRMVTASVIAQRTMEELRGLAAGAPFPAPTLESRFGLLPCPGADVPHEEVEGPDGTRYRSRLTVCAMDPPGGPLENLVRVQVVVSWADEGAVDDVGTDPRLRHRIVLETIRTRQDVL